MQSRNLAVVQVERVANDHRKRFRASVTDCSSRSFSSSFERGVRVGRHALVPAQAGLGTAPRRRC
jgi:hypothetical protein